MLAYDPFNVAMLLTPLERRTVVWLAGVLEKGETTISQGGILELWKDVAEPIRLQASKVLESVGVFRDYEITGVATILSRAITELERRKQERNRVYRMGKIGEKEWAQFISYESADTPAVVEAKP